MQLVHGVYTLALGGIIKESKPIRLSAYEKQEIPCAGQRVEKLYSNGYDLWIVADHGGVISTGSSLAGNTIIPAIYFETIADYDEGFFESEDIFTLEPVER